MASEEDVWIKICKIVTRCSLKNNLFLVPEHSGHFHLGTYNSTYVVPAGALGHFHFDRFVAKVRILRHTPNLFQVRMVYITKLLHRNM